MAICENFSIISSSFLFFDIVKRLIFGAQLKTTISDLVIEFSVSKD